jgi:hypothetical protein
MISIKKMGWVALFSGLCLGVGAATVTQVINLGAAYSTGWLETTAWSNGEAPSATNDYLCNTSKWDMRTPQKTVESSPTFLGNSLTITNGAVLKFKHDGVATVSNLYVWAGSEINNGGSNDGSTLAGNLYLKGSGQVSFNASTRYQIIDSQLIADSSLSTLLVTGGEDSLDGFEFRNTLNSFSGTWSVQSGTLKGPGLGQGDFEIGSAGFLNFGGAFSNTNSDLSVSIGGVITLTTNVTLGQVTLNGVGLSIGDHLVSDLKVNTDYGSAIAAASIDTAILHVSEGPVVVDTVVYQVGTHEIGASWNDALQWSDGMAPTNTADYINANDDNGVDGLAWKTRTPTTTDTFAGHSLSFTNGAILTLKGVGPWTVDTLNLWAGSQILNSGADAATLNGTLNLKGTGSVVLDAGITGRQSTIASLIVSDATITNIIVRIGDEVATNTTQAATAGYTISGTAVDNTFDGTWVVEEGFLRGDDFASGSFLVTDMGWLGFDGRYVNNDADLTVEANSTNSAQNGMLLIDANVTVGSATIWGVQLVDGTYTVAELKANSSYGAAIDSSSSDEAMLAVGASASLPVYQTKSQPTGLGWEDATTWDDGLAPVNTADYINNISGMETRSPSTDALGSIKDPVFAGRSLTLMNGAVLKSRHSGYATISNLTLYAGCSVVSVTGTGFNGDLALVGEGSITCDTQDDSRTLAIASLVTADETLTNIVITCTDLAFAYGSSEKVTGFTFSNPSNTFSGVWNVQKGYLKGAGMGQGSFLIGSYGYLDLDADYSNSSAFLSVGINPTNSALGGQILLDQNITVGSATLWGETLPAGTYTGATLKADGIYGGAFDAASSDTATLTVTDSPAVPEIGSISVGISGSSMVLGWDASSAVLYTLQADTNLVADPGWTNVVGYTDIPGINGSMSITNEISGTTMFYRVIGN